MSNLSTLPKGDSAWLFRKALERIIKQVSVLETNIGASTTGNSANTQVIFNDNGVLRGDPDFIFNAALNKLVALNIESTASLVVGTTATITGDLTVGTAARFNGGALAAYLNGSLLLGSSGNYVNIYGQSNGLIIKDNTGVQNLFSVGTAGVFTFGDGAGGTRMLLNSNGLGLGVTPSAWGNLKVVQFSGGSSIGGGFNANWIQANAYYDGTNWRYIATAAATRLQHDDAFKFFTAPSGTAGNAITFTQAMTLTSDGDLLVGKTAASVTTVGFQTLANGEASTAMASSTGAASTWNVYSTGAAAFRFYVAMNGTISATNTTISAISDARLKENVQDIDVGLGAILALKPRKFDWKEGKGKNIKGDRGFIAQEFETVFPNLIDEWKDAAPAGEAPYKSVRQDLIPVLVKAIQELTARVQTLETR